MSNLVRHAENELRAIGMLGSGDEMNEAMSEGVIQLLQMFSGQGHSGFSAGYAISLFSKLARFEPLGPITGEESEWVDVAEQNGGPLFQNKRCSHVFKDNEGAYDSSGVVFEEPDGCRFTGRYSHQKITFPYTPKQVTAYVSKDASEEEKRDAAQKAWEAA